jgi:hypothetical protein
VQVTFKEVGNYTLTLIQTSPADAARTEGQPVRGALVKCGSNNKAGFMVIGNTNDKGEVELKNMAVGTYTIVVEKAATATNTTKPAQN